RERAHLRGPEKMVWPHRVEEALQVRAAKLDAHALRHQVADARRAEEEAIDEIERVLVGAHAQDLAKLGGLAVVHRRAGRRREHEPEDLLRTREGVADRGAAAHGAAEEDRRLADEL